MILADKLNKYNTIFIDTAPIIYYIEAHPDYGPLSKAIVDSFQSVSVSAVSSVLTLTEVLSKPIETGDEKLARKFAEFLKHGRNLILMEISTSIAERAGRLRGKYPNLRTIDAVQIATAIDADADLFITNDKHLKHVKEIEVLVLKDFL
ncbi:MAG: PIN domain-containing protein [Deltaproteobacteria bacterium]|nr:PIN domain-containing protein [Deltaproteobacteria bacterium]